MRKRFDAAVVGIQVLDMLVTGVDASLFHRDSTTADIIRLAPGGDALNQSIALGQLGNRTALLGVLGSDRLGDTLLSILQDYPVEVFDRRVDRNTSISIVVVDTEGERHFLRRSGHNDALCYELLDQEVIKNAGILSIAGAMAFPNLDGEGMVRLLRLAKDAGALTAMDLFINRKEYDMAAIAAAFAHTDFLMPSLREAEFVTGETSPGHMAAALRELGAKVVVLKMGEKGCYLLDDAGPRIIPAFKARVVDTTGAGDNFAAAFLHGVNRGWDMDTCARFACAAGALAVEHVGASGFLQGEEQVLTRMQASG